MNVYQNIIIVQQVFKTFLLVIAMNEQLRMRHEFEKEYIQQYKSYQNIAANGQKCQNCGFSPQRFH